MSATQNTISIQKQYLKDYQVPPYLVDQVHLHFNIQPQSTTSNTTTTITCTQILKKNTEANAATDLWLDGEELSLKQLQAFVPKGGSQLTSWTTDISASLENTTPYDLKYAIKENGLQILNPPAEFILQIVTESIPSQNTSLEGLYVSNNCIVTQCEAQGFRRITYFLDRPDVMSKFTVRIEADAKKYPVLLSNGNCIETKTIGDRKTVTYQDPWKKPCYLFALVAGDLGLIKDQFKTQSGKMVNLEIYAAQEKLNRCTIAMEALKKSFLWDEQRFGREYDLSTYVIVAIDDFNAGAMENKGLNIFNSRLVLADPASATDDDFLAIESVVAHEYFHNWTGNRVTLRNWFELSLKEGLTVFRDQEFSMDMLSRDLVRIDNVVDLRDKQFPEDAGPNSHPIRPLSCFAVDNFFTATIYEKGAEVIRMMQTMVGRPGFRKGMDLYFDRHDGQAVTIEDFAAAIATANNKDWTQFKRWYFQAGTPQVLVNEKYEANEKKYKLTLKQSCELSSQEKIEKVTKLDFHIPLVFGLLDSVTKKELALTEKNNTDFEVNSEGQLLLNLTGAEQTFVFTDIKNPPVLSINRQFSAPIHLKKSGSVADDLFLMGYDTDSFNRWESAQNAFVHFFKKQMQSLALQTSSQKVTHSGSKISTSELVNDPEFNLYLNSLAAILESNQLDPFIKAHLMHTPSFAYLLQQVGELHPVNFLQAKNDLELQIAMHLENQLLKIYQDLSKVIQNDYSNVSIGQRRLKYLCLSYLSQIEKYENLVKETLVQAQNMTDLFSAFSIAVDLSKDLRNFAIQYFYEKWQHDSLVMNKWFSVQASSLHQDTFETVSQLWSHKDFNKQNPNKVYSLLRNFGINLIRFNDQPEKTYSFLAGKVLELDAINPQVATRVASSFNVVKQLPKTHQKLAQAELTKLAQNKLSANTYEIISKCLESLSN